MSQEQIDGSERIRALAARLGFLTEDEIMELAGYKPGSMETVRKRGDVPPYVRFGNSRLYPVAKASEWLVSRVRERASVPAGELL